MKKAADHASLLLGLLEILGAEAAVHGLLFLVLVVEVFLVLVARGPRTVGGRHGLRSAAAATTVAVVWCLQGVTAATATTARQCCTAWGGVFSD